MIHAVLIIFGLILFINALFDKWGWWHKLSVFGANSKYKFVYDITNCRFCLLTHLSILLTIVYGAIIGYEDYLLIIPFIVSGLLTLRK